MPDLDLYKIHNLDRGRPPVDLAAALTGELNSAPDPLSRSRIETAREILGDPQRRAQYDAALADSSVTVDETVLATIAGRPVPQGPRRGPFAEPKVKLLASVVAALALILVIAVIAVVATSGSDDAPAVAGDRSQQVQESSSTDGGDTRADLEAKRGNSDQLSKAAWSGSTVPDAVVHLTAAYDLPSDMARAAASDQVGVRELFQYQDRTIGVHVYDVDAPGGQQDLFAKFGQDGSLLSTKTYESPRDVPRSFDLAVAPAGNAYYQITAESGIAIPAAAAGTETDQQFAAAILPDAFDKKVFWVLLRGGDRLYKADLRWSKAYIDANAPK